METHQILSKDDSDRVRSWYARLRPLSVDIVGDYAGHELFVVHGDSLVAYILQEGESQVDLNYGLQLLHGVYKAEKFLAELRNRNCNFHILFFDSHASLCHGTGQAANDLYKGLLLRAVLIEHLSKSLAGINGPGTVSRFSSPHDPRFRDLYLSEHSVQFFLVYDSDQTTGSDHQRTMLLRAFMYQLYSNGHNVGFLRTVVFRSSKVFVPIVSASGKALTALELIAHDAVEAYPPLAHAKAQELSGRADLTIRDIVLLSALAEYPISSIDDMHAVYALVLHSIALRTCSLSERACEELDPTSLGAIPFASDFLRIVCNTARQIIPGISNILGQSCHEYDLYDALDGRVFLSILRDLVANLPIHEAAFEQASELLSLVYGTQHSYLVRAKSIIRTSGVLRVAATSDLPAPKPSVLPFNHPVLDEFLHDIGRSQASEPQDEISHAIFEDLTHWHTQRGIAQQGRHLPTPGFFARKRKQRFMNDIMSYAASLTDSVGKEINPEVLIVQKPSTAKASLDSGNAGARADHREKTTKVQGGKQKEQKRSGGRQAALDAARKLTEETAKNKERDIVQGWKTRFGELEREENLVQRYLLGRRFLQSINPKTHKVIEAEVGLYLCNVLARYLVVDNPDRGSIIGVVWSHILTAIALPMTPETAQGFQALVTKLRLPSPSLTPTLTNRPLPFGSLLDTFVINEQPIYFQLKHAGPYLLRSFDSRPDARVSFSPDAWQRRVLDAIDEDKSLFVVAPTSAGKTFISFYAMKKVLKADDDGVIVYVAPTKALVNQIAAEVVARFSKAYHRNETGGRCLWALKTRDYTINNPEQAQILITVPHVLQIMLLSGPNASRPSAWSRRVKRIIFDEVHCIGQAEDGIVWEQLLLMAPCPIVALSATVGNADMFSAWLAGTQKVRGQELRMISHNVRYSELRKFIYHAPKSFPFTGLTKVTRLPMPGLDDGESVSRRFGFLHPIAAIVDRKRTDLDDITLEPRDCMILWNTMKRCETATHRVDESLDPQACLPQIVAKADYITYELRLKHALCAWMHDPSSPFELVRESLRKTSITDEYGNRDEDRDEDNGEDSGEDSDEEARRSRSTKPGLFALLCDLHAQDALPALVFNYDRHECEQLMEGSLNFLVLAEEEWKQTSPEWKSKMARYSAWKKAKEARTTRTTAVAPDMSKLEIAREKASVEHSQWDGFDPSAPLEQFSFADIKKLAASELYEIARGLEEEPIRPVFLQALRRGLGVHHAGMNRRYRSVIEVLFRRGFLRVVIATGTLALGINMPCKTVVFARDSIFLTALNYRQASGRAGRRGFDLLGNIVFYDIPTERVHEIMSSRLPDLHGQFSLSTSLVLRLLILLSETKNGEYASHAMRAVLSQSRLYLGGPEAAQSIRHHLRFSVDFLRRQHLLSARGIPLNFAGMVSHLYFVENSALALHALLKGGYFHELCADIQSRPQQITQELVLVLAHLFGRIPIMTTDLDYFEETVKRSSSIVILPALPSRAETLLLQYNEETLGVFKNYVRSFAESNLADKPDCTLPLSGHGVGANQPGQTRLFSSLPPTSIRSPFVALSGHGDKFDSVKELCETVRSGVFLEESAVPYIDIGHRSTVPMTGRGKKGNPRELQKRPPLNAYLLDFFKHGSMEVLVRDNRIKQGDVWYWLQDFNLVLATIVTSLKNFVSAESLDEDVDMDAGDELDPGLYKQMLASLEEAKHDQSEERRRAEDVQAREAVGAGGNKGGVSVIAPSTRGRKVKVQDSWDDDDSDDGVGGELPAEHGWAGQEGSEPEHAFQRDGATLLKVLRAFTMLKGEFEETFRKVWA